MVYPKPAISLLVVLLLLPFSKGYTLYCDWFLTKYTDGAISSFPNSQNSGIPSLTSDNGSTFESAVTCGSLYMNQVSWNLQSDFSALVSGKIEFAVGFWVNFESTIGTEFFVLGTSSPQSMRVSSSKESELVVKMYQTTGSTDPSTDLTSNVPMSNFHIDQWFFLGFYAKDNGGGSMAWKMIFPFIEKSQTLQGSYALPSANFRFGIGIKAKFYEVVVAKSANFVSTWTKISLGNDSGTFLFTKACSKECSDVHCTLNDQCIAKLQSCAACSGGTCTQCTDDGLDLSTNCSSCKAGLTLVNGKCKLVCAAANNCDTCSISSTICDTCPANYFLYKVSASSTSCICKFYLACDDSCTNCHPGPFCYECADSIVQSGNTCVAQKIGYQISFDAPSIVLDFANPLSSALTHNSFTATTIEGAPILTTAWTFAGCTVGSVQCIIETDLKESDLPIDFNFKFAQA